MQTLWYGPYDSTRISYESYGLKKLTQAPMVSSWRPIQYQSPDPDEDAEIALYVAWFLPSLKKAIILAPVLFISCGSHRVSHLVYASCDMSHAERVTDLTLSWVNRYQVTSMNCSTSMISFIKWLFVSENSHAEMTMVIMRGWWVPSVFTIAWHQCSTIVIWSRLCQKCFANIW